jgi:hypothetical protein
LVSFETLATLMDRGCKLKWRESTTQEIKKWERIPKCWRNDGI